jgi:hypothetical protein
MKGYIPVDIPTKTYIKAYIIAQLGEKPIMNQQHWIGCKLYDLLQHKVNERKEEYTNTRYKCTLRIYINKHIFKQRGANLNETNLKNFNNHVEKKIKDRFYELMDDRIEILAAFTTNLVDVRRKLGIDIEAWDDDSMRKDYYRHRLEEKLPPLYKKNVTRIVPSSAYANLAF